ncbi:PLP-dependent aminotransferase family protein [Gulosibacter sediminis]|uniref:aminotransferase-like domain-containing protein n=1 Tax=Gulosibacter sediminis TaxID=1729695 RepID=UPI0024A7BCE3|nr:PLP-dependent aminotransferase family protein [Gulosibacter sediminis]
MTQLLHDRHAPELIRALTDPAGFGDATARNRRDDAIELLSGIPDPALLPVDALAAAFTEELRLPGAPGLQYGRTEGVPELREWIASREGVGVERVLITNGGFHGLSLAISLVLERGDTVAVDDPVFPLFLRGLELADARPLPIRVGPDGLDLDDLEAKLVAGSRPTALYTVPDFHNPSQGVLPLPSRRRLVELAERYNFTIINDNPYREIVFSGEPVSVADFNESDSVINVNTFTKTLGPGLRLGWVILPQRLVADAVKLRSRQDSHSSKIVQHAIARFLTSDADAFDGVLRAARPVYAQRARALVTALEREAPDEFELREPSGGFFVWARLTDDSIDDARLAVDASAEGIEYQRGAFFAVAADTGADRFLRLGFSLSSEEELGEAARRLARAIDCQRH